MAGPGRISCYLIGSDSLLVECGEMLLQRGHRVLGVISDADRLRSWARDRNLIAVPVAGGYREVLAETPFDYQSEEHV